MPWVLHSSIYGTSCYALWKGQYCICGVLFTFFCVPVTKSQEEPLNICFKNRERFLSIHFKCLAAFYKMYVHLVPVAICLSVQMFKLPNIWIFQAAANSLSNPKPMIFLPKFERKVDMSGQAVFCPNFVSTPISANLPIFQIYHIHFHTLGDWSQQSICWRHFSHWGRLWERVSHKMQIAPYL